MEISPDGQFLFVSHDFIDSVGVYTIAANGTITPIAGSPFATGGNTEHGLTLNPSATRLYVANESSGNITGFSIGAGGTLTPLPSSPYAAGVWPIEVIINPTDTFLFASNNFSNNISVYSIAGDGSLSQIGGSPFPPSGSSPSGLALDPTGTYFYVSNGGFSGSDDVGVYQIAGNGSITPIAGSPFVTGGTSGIATGIVYFQHLPIPTMTQWGMIIFMVLAGLGAVYFMRRKTRTNI